MLITIVQSEIEAAIRAYILTQINIKDGQEITMEFKNTRGVDGATAEINIGPVGNAPQKPTETVLKTEAPKTPLKPSMASPAPAVAATAPTSSEPVVSAELASATTVNTVPATEAPFEPPAFLKNELHIPEPKKEEPAPVTKPVFAKLADDTAPATAAPSKSLFANLTKPVNPKPAE